MSEDRRDINRAVRMRCKRELPPSQESSGEECDNEHANAECRPTDGARANANGAKMRAARACIGADVILHQLPVSLPCRRDLPATHMIEIKRQIGDERHTLRQSMRKEGE